MWPARLSGRPALVAVDEQALLVACPGGLSEQEARPRLVDFEEIKCVGAVILFRNKDKPLLRIELDSADDAQALTARSLQVWEAVVGGRGGSAYALSQVLLVTSNDLPGHEVTAIFGDVFSTVRESSPPTAVRRLAYQFRVTAHRAHVGEHVPRRAATMRVSGSRRPRSRAVRTRSSRCGSTATRWPM